MPIDARRIRVFLIDDDDSHLDLTTRLLTREGFEVRSTTQALGASNLVRDFQPDLVLVDVNIPALSGDRLLAVARRAAPGHTRFLLFSACDESRLRALAREVQADGWLSKSIEPGRLGVHLRALVTPGAQRRVGNMP